MTADEFNARYPIGTAVIYRPIIGGTQTISTRTRSDAWTLGSGHPVVMVEGVPGGVAVEAIEVVADHEGA